jgi:hypothetical protein
VTGGWRKLHNDELHNCLPDLLRVIKSSRMSWAGNLAHVREKKNVYRVLVGNTEDK